MVTEMSPREFLERRAAGVPMTLLDVREDWEVRLSPAPSEYLHIPMDEIPQRLDALERSAEVVVLCRVGGRSMQVAQFLERSGFERVVNLQGGILAWSRDVDPAIPVY
jgi:rhodanese-related sulfurtransferase